VTSRGPDGISQLSREEHCGEALVPRRVGLNDPVCRLSGGAFWVGPMPAVRGRPSTARDRSPHGRGAYHEGSVSACDGTYVIRWFVCGRVRVTVATSVTTPSHTRSNPELSRERIQPRRSTAPSSVGAATTHALAYQCCVGHKAFPRALACRIGAHQARACPPDRAAGGVRISSSTIGHRAM
jgi:hypothetical protein